MKRQSSDVESEISSTSSKKQKIDFDLTEIIEISDDESSLLREYSPADSGFKEYSTSVYTLSSESCSKTFQKSKSSGTASVNNRASNRIKKRQEALEKLIPTEQVLQQSIKVQNFARPLEKLSQAFDRLNPKVMCCKLSKYQVTMQLRLSQIIPKIDTTPDEIEFQGMILNKWQNFDGQNQQFYVRWMPTNVLDDEWILADYARSTKLRKKVTLSALSCRQRQAICKKIFSGNLNETTSND